MEKLFVIADDFTGALDTGVCFAESGISTRVILSQGETGIIKDFGCDVLVVDAETRHLPPQSAYDVVYRLTVSAMENGFDHIYKKTDSALRGNIGSELSAVLRATGEKRLHFVPAFPNMGRTTENGIQLIHGVPVSESVFADDPFEPVKYSSVSKLVNEQTDIPVTPAAPDSRCEENGIIVYNCQNEADLFKTAGVLKNQPHRAMAGCAGFARALPTLLNGESKKARPQSCPQKLIVVCGSVNPVTISQLDYAEQRGVSRIRLSPEQKLIPGYFSSDAGRRTLKSWSDSCKSKKCCIFDTNGEGAGDDIQNLREIVSGEQLRCRIADSIGEMLCGLLKLGVDSTLFITGGDTLLGFLKRAGCNELMPVRELFDGIVLSKMQLDEKELFLITKSGGFGSKEQIFELIEYVIKQKEI